MEALTRYRSSLKWTQIDSCMQKLIRSTKKCLEDVIQTTTYKWYLTISKIIFTNTCVLRKFHPWCQVGTFSPKKDQIHVHVPIWGGRCFSIILQCPEETASLYMGMQLNPQSHGPYQSWFNRAALLYVRLACLHKCVLGIVSYGCASLS